VAKGTRYGPDRPYPAQELVDLVDPSAGPGTVAPRCAAARPMPTIHPASPSARATEVFWSPALPAATGTMSYASCAAHRDAAGLHMLTAGEGNPGMPPVSGTTLIPSKAHWRSAIFDFVTSGQLLKICGFIHAAPTDPSRSRPFIPRIGRGPGGAPIDRCPAHLPRSHDSSLRDETHAGQARPRCMAG
jgi:hypothetical protein